MESPILILDGGLGTSLEQKYGCKFDHGTPLWSSDLLVSDPARLRRCQADFGRVPVDILLTATYQVSAAGFAATRDPEKQEPGISRARIPLYIDEALRVGHAAKAPDARLALSVGPYGACMVPSQEYSGVYDDAHSSQEALLRWHADRLRLFAAVDDVQGRVGYVALETVPRVDEIIAMRRALSATEALSALPCWISCLFPGDDGVLPDGGSVEAAVRAMLDPAVASPAWGVGINCTKVHKLDGLLRRYEDAVGMLLQEGVVQGGWPALVLYPDGTNGEVYNTTTQTWERRQGGEGEGGERVPWAKQLAEVVRATRRRARWRQIVVGGCCMAGAEDIAALRAELL
ncbi:hypothetical protein LMH87_011197 [Akanthomyces muscarius]|uniref:Hcy-binding domain-containing protein n=1 Tax=Akanthomyces muscarius TaxID=2231603 RepID=A0A9W8Q8P4_AKAMU|nr:hypothetical protein LMH87_011197 [Akanthomyces muscarius]KAJ4150447.1 hypothetical protein LMH87_011197 [Akanthomyces muscarius]